MNGQAVQAYELTLRGFSPRELTAQARRRCAAYFGPADFRVQEARCVPCLCSLGGHVRLYEARIVATRVDAAPTAPPPLPA